MSKQSEITCARDEGVVFSNIDQAISGSTAYKKVRVYSSSVGSRVTYNLLADFSADLGKKSR